MRQPPRTPARRSSRRRRTTSSNAADCSTPGRRCSSIPCRRRSSSASPCVSAADHDPRIERTMVAVHGAGRRLRRAGRTWCSPRPCTRPSPPTRAGPGGDPLPRPPGGARRARRVGDATAGALLRPSLRRRASGAAAEFAVADADRQRSEGPAEPRINAWVAQLLGDPGDCGFSGRRSRRRRHARRRRGRAADRPRLGPLALVAAAATAAATGRPSWRNAIGRRSSPSTSPRAAASSCSPTTDGSLGLGRARRTGQRHRAGAAAGGPGRLQDLRRAGQQPRPVASTRTSSERADAGRAAPARRVSQRLDAALAAPLPRPARAGGARAGQPRRRARRGAAGRAVHRADADGLRPTPSCSDLGGCRRALRIGQLDAIADGDREAAARRRLGTVFGEFWPVLGLFRVPADAEPTGRCARPARPGLPVATRWLWRHG